MTKFQQWVFAACISFALWLPSAHADNDSFRGPEAISFKNAKYQRSWRPGTVDQNGKRMNGTEIIKLVGHKGKLFAATSMWMESVRGLGGAQIPVTACGGPLASNV